MSSRDHFSLTFARESYVTFSKSSPFDQSNVSHLATCPHSCLKKKPEQHSLQNKISNFLRPDHPPPPSIDLRAASVPPLVDRRRLS
jgi:hypothetical protein